jgi:hypothetical protein
MGTLWALNQVKGYSVHATDGKIGHISGFYFEDEKWKIRYVFVDIGQWLPGRKVLISPIALKEPDWDKRELPVSITKQQVKTSPDINTDEPVARQHEIELHRHFGWEFYLGGEAMIGNPEMVPYLESLSGRLANINGKPFDPHLRSTRIVTGFQVQATDGPSGQIADFIAETDVWKIRYLVVDVHAVASGKKVLIAPEWTSNISWEDKKVYVEVPGEKIKNSPAFTEKAGSTGGYEEKLFDNLNMPDLKSL